jgi:hypothetical protein
MQIRREKLERVLELCYSQVPGEHTVCHAGHMGKLWDWSEQEGQGRNCASVSIVVSAGRKGEVG